MSPRVKHFSVITAAGFWFIFAVYFLYFNGLFTGGRPLIFERQSFGTIFGPIIIGYLIINHHSKPKENPKVSFLTLLFCLMGCGAIFLGIDSFLIKKIISFPVGTVIVIAGIFHLIIGYWTYENLPWKKTDSNPGLNQKDFDYEIINFSAVGEVVLKVNSGDFDVLSSGVYKVEVTDAAVQALSESVLQGAVKRLQLLNTLPQTDRDKKGQEYVKEMFNEMEDSSIYQIYPLLADHEKYLSFFYDGDLDLKEFVTNSINLVDKNLTAKDLEKAYFDNTPCADFWPVVSVYF